MTTNFTVTEKDTQEALQCNAQQISECAEALLMALPSVWHVDERNRVIRDWLLDMRELRDKEGKSE